MRDNPLVPGAGTFVLSTATISLRRGFLAALRGYKPIGPASDAIDRLPDGGGGRR
jgi:hypothetical protein